MKFIENFCQQQADSLADDFHQDALATPAVKLAVKNLLPGPEIELAAADSHHHLAPHHLAFEVRVTVIFSGAVMAVVR